MPINDGIGKEVISKFTSGLRSGMFPFLTYFFFTAKISSATLGSSKVYLFVLFCDDSTSSYLCCLCTGEKGRSKFYTDSNGREFMERVFNYRPTWDLEVKIMVLLCCFMLSQVFARHFLL